MVTVGVVVLVLAGVLTADIVLENSGQTEVMILGQALFFDIWGLFILGLATGVLVVAGVQLALQGFARDRQRRRAERLQARELAAMTRAVPGPQVSPARTTEAVVGAPAAAPSQAAAGGAAGRLVSATRPSTPPQSAPAPPAPAPMVPNPAPAARNPAPPARSVVPTSPREGQPTVPLDPPPPRENAHGAGPGGAARTGRETRQGNGGPRAAARPPADAVPAGSPTQTSFGSH